MRTLLLAGLVLLSAPALVAPALMTQALADDAAPTGSAPTSSALVSVQPARQGSLPAQIALFGTAAAAPGASLTLSRQQDGQIGAILVNIGQIVRAGDRLMEFAASPASASAYRQAVTALALARSQRAHASQLLAQHLATNDQLATADKAVSDAQSSLDALARAGGGQGSQSLAAPFEAIVTAIPVSPGDRVQPGAALMTLTRRDGIVVSAGIEPADAAQVHVGDPVSLAPLDSGPTLIGRVLLIAGALNLKTRLVDTAIAIPPGAALLGSSFHVTITTGQIAGWVVPHEAVLADADSAWLFQAVAGKAHKIPVTVAGQDATRDVVQGALDPAAPLIVSGAYQVDDGDPIRTGPLAPAPAPAPAKGAE